MSTSWLDWTNLGLQVAVGAVPMAYYVAPKIVLGESVPEVLRQINEILQKSDKLLELNKENIDSYKYKQFKAMYQQWYTEMTFEETNPSHTGWLAYLKPDSHRAKTILRQVKGFHTDVLSESRKKSGVLAFADANPAGSDSPQPVASSETSAHVVSAPTSSLSLENYHPADASLDLASGQNDEPLPIELADRSIQVLVTYIPMGPSSAATPGGLETAVASDNRKLYQQTVTFANEEGRLDITDPTLHPLDECQTHVSKERLHQLAAVGRELLSQPQGAIPIGTSVLTINSTLRKNITT